MKIPTSRLRIAATLLALLTPQITRADTALVAVAANFAEPATTLKAAFEAQSDHEITLSSGATGKLYAQITHGAPYDILLAADTTRPERLEEEGKAVQGSRFTYATGRLALWSANADKPPAPDTLQTARYRRLAIANPALAPYGLAAQQALAALGIETGARLVMGENIGQTFAMTATGNAEYGLVALSLILSDANKGPKAHWLIPADLHDAIAQQAVLLTRAKDNVAAREFLDFLKSDAARELIAKQGYDVSQ